MKLYVITAVSIFFLAIACKQNTVEKNKIEPNKEQEKLVKLNQYFLKQEAQAIKAYINRRNWNMKRTDSGLWHEIISTGNGKKFQTGQQVQLKYTLELLDGTICYKSDSTGIKTVTLGKDLVETGLTEGLEMLAPMAKARFILPAHLAYGVSGDGKCIPPRSAIVYYVEIISN